MQTASEYNLKFSEIGATDGSVDEIVMNMEGTLFTCAISSYHQHHLIINFISGGPYQEYFYIELPVSMNSGNAAEGSSIFKRFVYVHANKLSKFPMHFGVEVAAKVDYLICLSCTVAC